MDKAAELRSRTFTGEVTKTDFVVLGITLEDDLEVLKDDLAQTFSINTSLRTAKIQTWINSYAARLMRWKKLQAIMMPRLALFIPPNEEINKLPNTSVVSQIDTSAFDIPKYMPSDLTPELREATCNEELISTEVRLQYAMALASIVDLRQKLKMRYNITTHSRTQGSGPAGPATT